jgi:hypothetical protein
LPDDWDVVESWATDQPPYYDYFTSEKKDNSVNKIIGKEQPDSFWAGFPHRELPKRPTTRVNIKKLDELVKKHSMNWTLEENTKARRAIKSLKHGAPACQVKELPALRQKNAPSAYEHADKFTDAMRDWVAAGVVAGPFKSPPLPGFRANCLMAVARKSKVRPVVNLSSPKGTSFNDNIEPLSVMKVTMSSAAQFGQSVLAAGRGARMSKLDMKDAYKLVPARVEDFRLQGMEWQGRYFVDTQQIFGAATAAANFDVLASTMLNIVLSEFDSDRLQVHRTLDDAACVSPANSLGSRQFAAVYRRIADQLNIQLAPECPDNDKAFTDDTWGTVLGIVFNSETMCWRMPAHKVEQLLATAGDFIGAGWVSLEETQIMAGRVNHLAQMMPFLKAFRRPLNDLLGEFGEDEEILLRVRPELAADLKFIANAAITALHWLPIAAENGQPPTDAWRFVSDAAGGLGNDDWAGVASLGMTESEKGIWFVCRGSWPDAVYTAVDEKGARLASKMTTLEAVGLLLPLLTVPHVLAGYHVVLGVDNLGVVFGWRNGGCKGDRWASILIRALHIVAAFLNITVHVHHVPRLSSAAAVMADSLTRSSTATAEVWAQATGAQAHSAPAPLWRWLADPQDDWELGFKLVNHLKEKK